MSIRSLKSTSSYYPEKCTLVLMEEYYGHRRRLVLREFAPFELATAQSRDPACVQPAGSTLGEIASGPVWEWGNPSARA